MALNPSCSPPTASLTAAWPSARVTGGPAAGPSSPKAASAATSSGFARGSVRRSRVGSPRRPGRVGGTSVAVMDERRSLMSAVTRQEGAVRLRRPPRDGRKADTLPPPLDPNERSRVSRVVLVTGGNRGIGLATAREFAERGLHRGDHPPFGRAAGGAARRHVRRHRLRRRRRRVLAGRVRARAGRGGRRQRRHHPRRPAHAHARGRVHRGPRRQPHRGLAGHPARDPGDGQGPLRPADLHLQRRRAHRRARAGELRRLEGRPRRPRPLDGPRARRAAASPPTSSPPATSTPT